MVEEASRHGFAIERAVAFGYQPSRGVYFYSVRSGRDISHKIVRTFAYFDGDTGELQFLDLPTGQYSGNTVTSWLVALHTADVFGLPYRLLVCALGLVITMLSVTGVYIWWRKRRARKFSKLSSKGAVEPLAATARQAVR